MHTSIKKMAAVSLVGLSVFVGSTLGSRVSPPSSTDKLSINISGPSWAESFDSIDQQFARAHVVVRARVAEQPHDDSNGGFPVVATGVRVLESFKGNFQPGESILVHQAGSLDSPDAELPFLDAKTEYLLFLTQQFAGEPQYYILSPTGLFLKGSTGRFERLENLASKIPPHLDLELLRNLDPVQIVDLPRAKVYETMNEMRAAADSVVVIEVQSEPRQREAEAIPTVSLTVIVSESIKGDLRVGDVIDFGMFANVRGKLAITGGYPAVLKKNVKYLLFLEHHDRENEYRLVDPAGVFTLTSDGGFSRNFELDTSVQAAIALKELT